MRRRQDRSAPPGPFSIGTTGTYAIVIHSSSPVSTLATRMRTG